MVRPIILILLLLPLTAWSKPSPRLLALERQLAAVGFDLVECRSEKDRDSCLQRFNALMDTAIHMEGSWDLPFDSVRNVSKVMSPDKAFRIFTWSYRFDNDSFLIYGLIQFPEGSREEDVVYLKDSSHRFGEKDPVYKDLDPDNWYGALYYDIIVTKKKRQKYYTLLGYDPGSRAANTKVLEVLWFDKKDEINFGAPLFKVYSNRSPQKRVIWHYSDKAAMMVRYEPKKDIIAFDNMIPTDKKAKGIYSLYLPDGTYDYFRLRRGMWIKNEMMFDNVRNATED